MKKCFVKYSQSDFQDFSFPINKEYRHSIAVAGIQSGIVVAYASDKLIIVLISGKYIAAILRGHQAYVCTLAFEQREPHIISCDIEANCLFWHYHENSWQYTRTVKLSSPATSMSWCGFRRLICYSSKEGLFSSPVSTFGTDKKKLAPKSEMCAFNFDASLIASHTFGKYLTIFNLTLENYCEVLKLSSNIVKFDFHPRLTILLTYSTDGIIRIWKQSRYCTFACSAAISAPAPGCFIHMPIFFPEKYTFRKNHMGKIAFVDDNEKIITLFLSETGRFISGKPAAAFEGYSFRKKDRFDPIHAYHTNSGTIALTVSENCISLVSKPHKNTRLANYLKTSFWFHAAPIVMTKFAPDSLSLISLDKTGIVLVWFLYSTTKNPYIACNDATNIAWVDNENFIYSSTENKLFSVNLVSREKKAIDFPQFTDIKKLYVFNNEPVVITNDLIITNSHSKHIPTFDYCSMSQSYNNYALIIFGKNNGKIKSYYIPTFQEFDVVTVNKEIFDVCVVSLYEFAVMAKNEVIFFSNADGNGFSQRGSMTTPPLKNFCPDSHMLGSRIIAHDGKSILSLQNNSTKLISMKSLDNLIDFIEVSSIGDLCLVCQKNFYFHSGFSQLHWDERIPYRRHVKEQTITLEEHKILRQLEKDCDYMVAQDIYIDRLQETSNICRNTLVHLLEFSSAYNLEDVKTLQIPAYPNQIAFPEAFQLPDNADEQFTKSLETIKNINKDLDMYAMRYLLGIFESNKPPTFLALWFSFSSTQAQICEMISDRITTANISPFFVGICIKEQRLLEDFTSKALSNTWKEFQKPELVALFHIAMGNVKKLPKLYNTVGDNPRAEFFNKDFSQERWRKSALKNAYSSMSHHGFDMAAALFLIADDVDSAIGVIVNQMKDPVLAFHILRLKEKSINGPHMKKFLQSVEWDDEVIPCIISNLVTPTETPKYLRKALNASLRPTIFGDQRPALFQILYHLTRNKDDATPVAHSLLCSGLAPLASYVLKYSECPYDKPRLTGAAIGEIDKVEETESEEEKKNMFASSTNSDESDHDFDFGGGGMDEWDDDEDSDAWKSSSEDEDEEKSQSEKEEEAEEKIETEQKVEKEENQTAILIKEFIERRVKSLSNLFAENNVVDADAATFCIHFAAIDFGKSFLDEKEKEILAAKLSNYIDFCGLLFLNSAKIPSRPANLFGLTLYLRSFFADPNQALTLKSIMELPKNGYTHSVFFGAFIVGLWTFLHHLICQILGSSRVDPIIFVPSDLPPPQALFNADIFSPRYPDSVPDLLSKYATGTSLDRDRTLTMYLLMNRFCGEISAFQDDKDKDWQELLMSRLMSLMKTLHFFQVAFQSPPFAIPNTSSPMTPLTEIIVEAHKNAQPVLAEIQKKSLGKVATPAIYRGNSLAITKEDLTQINFVGNAMTFATSPTSRDRIVVVADQVYMTTIDKKHTQQILGFSSSMLADTITILSHPHFDLFILVTKFTAYLMDGTQKDVAQFCLETSMINCAAFSPNGTKVAFGSHELIIVQLEIGREKILPVFRLPTTKQITSLCWLNSDTQIIVGTESCILLADTLTGEMFKLAENQSWGTITCIKIDDNCKYLVFGTSTGKTVLVDMQKGFETVCVYSLTSSVVSITILVDLCVIASSDGLITAFPVGKTTAHASFNSPVPITCFAAQDNAIIATGNKSLLVWKVQ